MNTESIEAMLARAVALHQAGRLDEASGLYKAILARDARNADAVHLTGVIAFQQGRLDDARRTIRDAIALNPDAPMPHANLGRTCKALGRFEEAEAAWRAALAIDGGQADVLADLGGLLAVRGRAGEGRELCERALALRPDLAVGHQNLGLARKALGEDAAAIAAFRRAGALAPDMADAHFQLGLALQETGDPAGAEDAYRRALALEPGFALARSNLGNVLRVAGRLDEAVDAYAQAAAAAPDSPDIRSNLGVALQEAGRFDEALAAFEAAIALDGENAEAHRHRGMLLLLLGRFEEGWAETEWRWRTKTFRPQIRDFGRPKWDGFPLAGRTVLIYAEQGLGDTLQFVRYLPLVAARGARVVFECQPPLKTLLADAADTVVGRAEDLPDFEVHAPLMSLPYLFGTDAASIPFDGPYVEADPARRAVWKNRLGDGFKVGLCWRGNPNHPYDHGRSVALERLRPVLEVPGARLVSLQLDATPEEIAGRDLVDAIGDFDPALDLFAEDAAVLANLDLVISVDTSIAHLAGAMGLPTWLMLPATPDWRWRLDRDVTPWYPSMRLFRQVRPGDWDGVAKDLARALEEVRP